MRFIFTLTLAAAALFSQAVPPAATGSISGRVIDADTRMPVAGAKVGSSALGGTKTDADGKYTIAGLAAGRTVRVEVDFEGGANIDDIAVIPREIMVAASRDTAGVDFKVRLDGSISGHVFDSKNEPLAGIQVTVFFQNYRADPGGFFNNSDKLLNYSTGLVKMTTDDRGAFSLRSSFLRAGRPHWIYAEPNREYASPISDTPAAVEARKKILVPTYYPNATSLSTAVPIVLHSLEHLDNVDIHMSSGESYCISGTLTISGKPASINFAVEHEAMSALHSNEGIPRRGGLTGDDGKISVCGLSSGTYQLTAFGKGLPNLVDAFGTTRIDVSNADVRDVLLDARPPINLEVELAWDKAPTEAVSPSIRVQEIPAFRPTFRTPSSTVPGVTSFTTLPSLPLGFNISGLSGSLYVKNVELDGRSVFHRAFDPGTGSSRLRITFARDSGTVAVQTDKASVAVMIIPESAMSDAELANTLIAGLTDGSGNFTASQVPPGRYRVLVTENPPYSRILRPTNLYIDRIPETLRLLLRNRALGQLVEVPPNGRVPVRAVPRDLQ